MKSMFQFHRSRSMQRHGESIARSNVQYACEETATLFVRVITLTVETGSARPLLHAAIIPVLVYTGHRDTTFCYMSGRCYVVTRRDLRNLKLPAVVRWASSGSDSNAVVGLERPDNMCVSISRSHIDPHHGFLPRHRPSPVSVRDAPKVWARSHDSSAYLLCLYTRTLFPEPRCEM